MHGDVVSLAIEKCRRCRPPNLIDSFNRTNWGILRKFICSNGHHKMRIISTFFSRIRRVIVIRSVDICISFISPSQQNSYLCSLHHQFAYVLQINTNKLASSRIRRKTYLYHYCHYYIVIYHTLCDHKHRLHMVWSEAMLECRSCGRMMND